MSNSTLSSGFAVAAIIGTVVGSLCCLACCIGTIVGAVFLVKYLNKQNNTVGNNGMILQPYPQQPPYASNYPPAYPINNNSPAYPMNNNPPEYRSEKSQMLPPRATSQARITEITST
ncbi:hypothetical protein I4U23_008948 [Adineta vaga]|nr:hypothetical protein I4U23_008948 [Adineta vaga]